MRLPSQISRRSALRFNITPLIDVVFLLIIFFLVASHFVRNEQSQPVELPMAEQGIPDADAAASRLTITIDQAGQLFVAGKPHSGPAVLEQIAQLGQLSAVNSSQPEIRIRSDRRTEYQHVRDLLEHCASAGISSIRFAVTVDDSR